MMTCTSHACFDCHSSYIIPIVREVLHYLGIEASIYIKATLKEAWGLLNDYLQEKYGGWREIFKKGFESGQQAVLKALEAVKDEIIRVCEENHALLRQLTMLATKSLTSAASKVASKATVSVLAKEASQQAAKQSTKVSLTFTMTWSPKISAGIAAKKTSKMAVGQIAKSATKYATPLGVGADLAQAGLELLGYKEVGKAFGVTGNIASGALMGAPFGPPGVALGALVGFVTWGGGEVVGGLVDRAFGGHHHGQERNRNEHHGGQEQRDEE